MTKKMNLSPTAIESLKAGRLSDHLTPGLCIERLGSGRLVWQYERRIPAKNLALEPNERAGDRVKVAGGSYPAMTIAAARAWAGGLNVKVEDGIDPREAQRLERSGMTMNEAHVKYIEAVKAGTHRVRKSTDARPIKPRTIDDKKALWRRYVRDTLGSKLVSQVTDSDVEGLIEPMTAKIQANRLGSELRVFCQSASKKDPLSACKRDPLRRAA